MPPVDARRGWSLAAPRTDAVPAAPSRRGVAAGDTVTATSRDQDVLLGRRGPAKGLVPPRGLDRGGPAQVLRRALRRRRGRLPVLRPSGPGGDRALGAPNARRVHLSRQGLRRDDVARGCDRPTRRFACSGLRSSPSSSREAPGRPPPVPPALHRVRSPRRTSSRGRPSASRRSSHSSSSATRSWLEEAERADTLAFLEANGLAFVSLDSPHPGLERLAPRRGGHAPGRVRPLPRAERGDLEHPRGAVCRRALRPGSTRRRARGWVEPIARLAGEAARRSARSSATTRTTSRRGRADPPRAPRRGGDPRRGRDRASADRARRSSDRR